MNPILTRLLAAKAEATLIAATMTRDPYEGTNKDECSQVRSSEFINDGKWITLSLKINICTKDLCRCTEALVSAIRPN